MKEFWRASRGHIAIESRLEGEGELRSQKFVQHVVNRWVVVTEMWIEFHGVIMERAGFNDHGLVEIHVRRRRCEKFISSEYDLMPPAPSLSFHIEVSWDYSGGPAFALG
jgi:hypothetical protein